MSVDLPSQFERLSVHHGGRSLDASINNNNNNQPQHAHAHAQWHTPATAQTLHPVTAQQYAAPSGSHQMRKQRSQRFTVPLNPTASNQYQQSEQQQPQNASVSSIGSLSYSTPSPNHLRAPNVAYEYPSSSSAPPVDGSAQSMERSLSQESNPYSQASFEDPTPAHYAAPSISGFNFASPHMAVPPRHVINNTAQYPSYAHVDQSLYNAYPSAGPQDYSSSYPGRTSQQMEQAPSRGAERSSYLSSEWVRGQQQQQQTLNFVSGATAFPPQDDEVIPTAIVIKNIPFAAPKEHLLAVMEDLRLPPPFAFNYHYDQGQFRGLAFANFRQAQDAALAVSALNGFDLQGRKLRAEFKKVLKEGEKERIERDKAIRRMRSTQQLVNSNEFVGNGASNTWPAQRGHHFGNEDEDYGKPVQSSFAGPMSSSYGRNTFGMRQFVSGASLSDGQYSAPSSAANGYSASPPSDVGTSVSARMVKQASTSGSELSASDSARGRATLDLNDPQSLEIFSRVLLFKDDSLRDELSFARSLTASQRRIVHLVARKLGLEHQSVGAGEDRHVVVFKSGAGPTPTHSSGGLTPEPYHKALRHSASTLGRQLSRDGPAGSFLSADASGHLRGKKSMPDIRAALYAGPQGYPGPPSFYHPPPNDFQPVPGTLLGHAPLQQQRVGQPSQQRSNANLRDSYAIAVNGLRQAPQGSFQSSQPLQHMFDSSTLVSRFAPTGPSLGVPHSSHAQRVLPGAPQYSSDGGSSSSPNLSIVGLNGGPPTDSSHTSVSEESHTHKAIGPDSVRITRQPVGPPANAVEGDVSVVPGTRFTNDHETTTRNDSTTD
ncbi:Peptidyl-prolyl cis-trans isomerase pin4 [Microbotryomycetes sp. JL201]|nr:Peptidyl-prolyl cis-trans isomerase pin4 [Microbotryomycetes sp. JL201]